MAMVACPVCQMQIESGEAFGRAQYEGETYYFCSAEHQQLFEGNPGAYAQPASAADAG